MSQYKLKVIHYYDRFYPYLGGAETHIANTIDNLSDVQFDVVTNQLPDTSKIDRYRSNCLIRRFGPIDKGQIQTNKIMKKINISVVPSLLGEIIRMKKKLEYIKKSNSDLIHIHAPFLSMPLLSFDLRFFKKSKLLRFLDFSDLKKPCVLTIHAAHLKENDEPINYEIIPIYNDYFKRWLKPADEIIVVEKFLYSYLKNYLENNNIYANLHFIPNSVDTDLFDYRENIIENKLKVLYVGRINKSLNYLLRFIDNIPIFVEFNIVGSGYPEDFIELEKHVGDGNIRLYKNITLDKLIGLYHEANIIWNPVGFESISRVTLESMSCGRPVIMIDKGDRTPVVHNKTGFLVDKSIESLINILECVYNNHAFLQRLSENSRKIIESDYCNAVIIPKIKKIYLDLTN